MTVIAYRDGVLAADTQVSGDGLLWAHTDKIVRAKDGTIGGAAGDVVNLAAFLQWLRDGAKGKFSPASVKGDFDGLLITPDGVIWSIETHGRYPIKGEFVAIGSGEQLAIGAMAAGANAVEAVEIAKQFDSGCGGETMILRLEATPWTSKRSSRKSTAATASRRGI